jgi:hypothetical protein
VVTDVHDEPPEVTWNTRLEAAYVTIQQLELRQKIFQAPLIYIRALLDCLAAGAVPLQDKSAKAIIAQHVRLSAYLCSAEPFYYTVRPRDAQ